MEQEPGVQEDQEVNWPGVRRLSTSPLFILLSQIGQKLRLLLKIQTEENQQLKFNILPHGAYPCVFVPFYLEDIPTQQNTTTTTKDDFSIVTIFQVMVFQRFICYIDFIVRLQILLAGVWSQKIFNFKPRFESRTLPKLN